MNLLLLFSALLSALTGVVSTARAPTAAHAVAAASTVSAVAVRVTREAAARPNDVVADLRRVAASIAVPAVVATTPLYASRRRE